MDVLREFFERHSLPAEPLVHVRKAKLMRDWWNAFAAPHKQPGLKWPDISNDSLWEIFSTGCVPCFEGEAAWDAFSQFVPGRLIIVPDSRCSMYDCDATGCADFSALIQDLENFLATEGTDCLDTYLIDIDFRWTWAFTHETSWSLGPYFATAEHETRSH
ncbi:MAG: DUF4275 family protein [Planctomycetaceae bacterium]